MHRMCKNLTHIVFLFVPCLFIRNSFDLQLEQFGVDLEPLQRPATTRIFRALLEDWEKDNLMSNDCAIEACLLEKYQNLVFYDPDTGTTFTVASENLEFHRGRKGGGWHLICESSDNSNELEPFDISLANHLIGETPQEDSVEIIHGEAEAV